jgi:hypothetical protein
MLSGAERSSRSISSADLQGFVGLFTVQRFVGELSGAAGGGTGTPELQPTKANNDHSHRERTADRISRMDDDTARAVPGAIDAVDAWRVLAGPCQLSPGVKPVW